MNLTRHHGGTLILLTFAAAMLLTIIPLSDGQRRFRLYRRAASVCTDRHPAGTTRPGTQPGRLYLRAPAPAHSYLSHVATGTYGTDSADFAPVVNLVDRQHYRPSGTPAELLVAITDWRSTMASGIPPDDGAAR